MRRPLALALIAFVLASPAGAQQKGRLTVPAAGVALRGAQTATSGADAVSATDAAAAALASARALSTPLPQAAAEPGQCRLACAQEYYFCLAGDGTDDCAPHWGQCRAACDAPGALPNFASTSPG